MTMKHIFININLMNVNVDYKLIHHVYLVRFSIEIKNIIIFNMIIVKYLKFLEKMTKIIIIHKEILTPNFNYFFNQTYVKMMLIIVFI